MPKTEDLHLLGGQNNIQPLAKCGFLFFRKEGAAQLLCLLSSYCTRLNKMLANINFLANISYQCSQLIKKSHLVIRH